jgi:hypothetical protein
MTVVVAVQAGLGLGRLFLLALRLQSRLALVARLNQAKQVTVMLVLIQYFQVLRQQVAVVAVLDKVVEIGKTAALAALVVVAVMEVALVP